MLNLIFETQFYNSSKNSFEQIKFKKNCFKRLSLVETLYYSIEYCIVVPFYIKNTKHIHKKGLG